MEQTTLFELPSPTTHRRPTGTFLSRNVLFFEAFAASETLLRVAKSAVRSNHRRHGSDRNAAAPFEDAFKAAMLEPDTLADIASETVKNAADKGLTVSDVAIQGGKDKTLADIVVSYRTGGETISIATNIKRLLPGSSHTEGGSILAFLRLALDAEYDPANPPTTRGFDWEQTIVEWLAGRRKIQPGRDYFLLIVHADKTAFHGIDTWPVISGMSGDRPCAYRHTNRAVLEVAKPTTTIRAGFDINAALASALLPAPNPGAARALLTALAMAMNPQEEAAKLAGQLLSLDDWKIGGIASDAAQ